MMTAELFTRVMEVGLVDFIRLTGGEYKLVK